MIPDLVAPTKSHSLNYALFLSYYIINTNLKDLDLRKLYNLEWYELINVVKFYNCKEWFNKCFKKKQYYSVFLKEHRNPRVFSNFALHLFYPKFMKDCVTLTWLSVRVYNKLHYYDELNPTKSFMPALGHRPGSPFVVELLDDHISW